MLSYQENVMPKRDMDRCKLVAVSKDTIFILLGLQKYEWFAIAELDLPDDAVACDVFWYELYNCFFIKVWSASFEKTPPGVMYSEIAPQQMVIHHLKRRGEYTE